MKNVTAFHTRDYAAIAKNVVLAIALYQVLGGYRSLYGTSGYCI